jgi:ribosomal protein S18 acetylase RimI-like enzyme
MSREATSTTPLGWLVLLVHRDNRRAIKFYEKCGFELILDVVRHKDHFVMRLWIGAIG